METYCCQYATDSAEIKDRWELTMTRGESQAVLEMLDPCQNLPGVEVWTTLGTTMRELKPEPTEEPETSFQSSWATRTRRRHKPESTDGRREGWANWDEGAYKGESLGSIGTDVTPQRAFSSRTGPRERSMEAGNRVIVRSDAAGCTRGPGGREFGGAGSAADSAVRLGVEWLAVGPGREWPAQPKASPGEDAK